MGFIPEPTPEMGPYSVEVRRESFYLSGEPNFVQKGVAPCPSGCTVIGVHVHGDYGYVAQRHAVTVYPAADGFRQGTVELLIEDIPFIRAALDCVEASLAGPRQAAAATGDAT